VADTVIFDTDVLIDASRGIKRVVAYLQQVEQESFLGVSVVTQMELIVGCRNKVELRSVERFLLRFQIVKFNEHISDIAIDLLSRYRLSYGLLIADAIIAATAMSLGSPLVTKNQRDYRFIMGLHLLTLP
jgi:predicted nucleic acid-binding protein